MTPRTENALDERLLAHHPAGRACVEVCRAHGWQPTNADVIRLVHLKHQICEGERSETALSPTRLAFARWLYRQGRISDWGEPAPSAQPLTSRP